MMSWTIVVLARWRLMIRMMRETGVFRRRREWKVKK